jgi:signal transduction histidine kinase
MYKTQGISRTYGEGGTALSKIKKLLTKSLAMELLFSVIFSLVFAYFSYHVSQDIGYNYLDNKYNSDDFMLYKEKKLQTELQKYIDQESIRSQNIQLLKDWASEQKSTLTLYYNHQLMLDSEGETIYDTSSATDSAQDTMIDYSLNMYPDEYLLEGMRSYTVTLTDSKEMKAAFYYYGYYTYYSLVHNAALTIGIVVFLILFLLFIQKKVKYIHHLSDDLYILEGGNLEYEVFEKGNDELYLLANGINKMRVSILRKQERENYNRDANQKLVTALSHDIRTPLTSLIGYLELLRLHRYKDEEQLTHFLETSIQKSYQIKDLSDKLFEYFIVSEKTEDSYNKEPIPTNVLLDSLADNQLFDLENSGFEVQNNFDQEVFSKTCLIDIEFIQRVLDNLLSNIKKYADPSFPVKVEAHEGAGKFLLRFHNIPSLLRDNVESTGIGIKTCEKIMREHGGDFRFSQEEETFISTLTLPVL